jgi:hypothetical protein
MSRANKNDLTAENLKNALWETLQGVRAKRVSPEIANATAVTSREIMRVVRTELAIQTLAGARPGARMLEFTDSQSAQKTIATTSRAAKSA